MIALFLMMLLVAVDVTGRYVFSKPIKGALEIDELMMVIVAFLAFAYCTYRKGHIMVELVLYRLSRRTQAIMNGFTSLISAFIVGLAAWQMGIYGYNELFSLTGQVTLLLSIPIAPFFLISAFAFALMLVELLFNSYHYFVNGFSAQKPSPRIQQEPEVN
jgi:TRAP-type C4-dicarboxylate transport system permease small subunit